MSSRRYLDVPDIRNSFDQVGLENGDTVMLHCDAMVTAQFPPAPNAKRFDLLVDTLEEVLGEDGTLVLPTFTYSFTQGDVFDIRHSPSSVGAISEFFRTRSGVVRSSDPLFSVAAKGRHAAKFADSNNEDCFGKGSAFDLLLALDGKVLCLGCSLDRVTFVHYVEQRRGVDYRYLKRFSGEIIDLDGKRRFHTVRLYVRDLEKDSDVSLSKLRQRLVCAGLLKSAELGRVGIAAVGCGDFFRIAQSLLDEDPTALIEEGKEK